jgi:hypothetical protein
MFFPKGLLSSLQILLLFEYMSYARQGIVSIGGENGLQKDFPLIYGAYFPSLQGVERVKI